MVSASEPQSREIHYEYAPNLPGILNQLGISLVVSTYQAGKIVVLSARGNALAVTFHAFNRPLGVAFRDDCLAVASRREVWFLGAAPSIARGINPTGTYDACFLARYAHYTGEIEAHDLAWASSAGGNELWVVNTLFSCLCTLGGNFCFVPRWRPPFISALAAEDRCHLNGLALEEGRPRYVTALSQSDTRTGWRADKVNTGCVIDVSTGRTLATGFAMPHSPRLHAGRLWLLDSGRGRLVEVDRDGVNQDGMNQVGGAAEAVASLPGYTRGLGLCGGYAFVGLSKIRQTSMFGGVPIAERKDQLKCGVAVVELATGNVVSLFEFKTVAEEIFEVAVLPKVRAPFVQGPSPGDDQQEQVWLAASETAVARGTVKSP
jgi:uncharacterized protein (TIGR03032 family)